MVREKILLFAFLTSPAFNHHPKTARNQSVILQQLHLKCVTSGWQLTQEQIDVDVDWIKEQHK